MRFTDTHCHIHDPQYPQPLQALGRAREAGVGRLICVGTDEANSRDAVAFAAEHDNVWASLGTHPHDTKDANPDLTLFRGLLDTNKNPHVGKIAAIGEIGLDYFYTHSPKANQIALLEAQLQLALDHKLPVIFHVRDAFEDFWPIFDAFRGLRGVLHSFTDNLSNLEQGLARGLYVGVNGISTFTKDELQRQMFASIPVDSLVFETDSPFLTPIPHRGMVNEPAFITQVAHYIANLQAINLEELSRATERNATTLFFSN